MSQNLLVRQNSFLDGTTKVNIDDPIPVTTSHPIFKLQPLHEILLTLGQRLKIECQGDGDNIRYQWFKDDVLLKVETANYLIRDNISQIDLGKYDVKIIDKWGRWTSSTCYVKFEQLQTNNTYQSSYNNYQSANNYLYNNQTQMQNAFQPIQPPNQMYNYTSENVAQPMYQHAQMDNYTIQNVAQPMYPLNIPMHPQNPMYNYSSQNFAQPIYPQNQFQNNIPQNFTQPIYRPNQIQNNTSQNFTQSWFPQNQIQNNIPQNFTQPIYPQNQIQNNTDSQNFTQSTFPQNQIQNYSSQTFTQPENSQIQMPLHSMTSQPLPDNNYLTTNNFNPAHDQSTISNNQNAANNYLAVLNKGYNDAYLNDFSEEERQLKEEGLLPPKLDLNNIKPSQSFLRQLSLAQRLARVGLSIDYLIEIPNEYRPRFTKQPISQTLRSKDSVRLDCTAEDTNEYQWYKDGVAIEGATKNDHLISNAQHSDEGFYSCVIRNLYTFISSDIIKIDINDQ